MIRATRAGIQDGGFTPNRFGSRPAAQAAMGDALVRAGAQLIVLAGFDHILTPGFFHKMKGRPIINIHPALLPLFGGKGMLGDKVHEAVLKAGATESGVTVHHVQPDRVDDGEVILQVRVPVLKDDDVPTLAARVLDAEHQAIVDAIRHFQSEGVAARVNLALDGLPPVPGNDAAAAHLRIAPSLEYIERAYDDAKYGAVSKEPFLDIVIPSLVDPDLAPRGKHVMSVLVQYTPYHRKDGEWSADREAFGDAVVDRLDARLPGLRRMVVGREVLTPPELEARFGLTDGHMYHGEMTLNQQLVLRPAPGWSQYRTPIRGLYLCGSGAHPGGGVTGAPGYNAAHAVLKDWASLR